MYSCISGHDLGKFGENDISGQGLGKFGENDISGQGLGKFGNFMTFVKWMPNYE